MINGVEENKRYNLPKYFEKLVFSQRNCLFDPLDQTPDATWTFHPDGKCEHFVLNKRDGAASVEHAFVDPDRVTRFFNDIRECALNRTNMTFYLDDLVEELVIYTKKRKYILDRGIITENTSIGDLAWEMVGSVFRDE